MKKIVCGLALTVALTSGIAYAQSNPTVGGAPMMVERNIVENAVNSPIHTTLVAAVKEAGLVETLSGTGPFTVFAPTDEAFAELPAGTVDTLMQPESNDQLTKVLTYHVVPGKLSGGELLRDVQANGGKLELEAVSGDTLTLMESGPGLAVMDESGNTAIITIAEVNQSNGVIHVIDGVLLPQ